MLKDKKSLLYLAILLLATTGYAGTDLVSGGPDVSETTAPLSVTLAGPDLVPTVDACTWWAVVTGGNKPYEYEWSGIHSGSNHELIVIGAQTEGMLYITVTDEDENQDGESVYVDIRFGAPDCLWEDSEEDDHK